MPVPARFLALGDSYTIGEGVAAEERWPAQLARRLDARGIALADPEIVAATGWTTDELAAGMDDHAFAPPYALASLLIGVNDQYRGRGIDAFASGFRALFDRAATLAGDAARVLVVSIPDWGVTRFAREQGRDAPAVAAQIDAFNAVAHEVAVAAGSTFVDVTAASREAGDHPGMLVADGLHPSAAQYAIWVDAILPAALRILDPAAR